MTEEETNKYIWMRCSIIQYLIKVNELPSLDIKQKNLLATMRLMPGLKENHEDSSRGVRQSDSRAVLLRVGSVVRGQRPKYREPGFVRALPTRTPCFEAQESRKAFRVCE